jgi:hypothetical protein
MRAARNYYTSFDFQCKRGKNYSLYDIHHGSDIADIDLDHIIRFQKLRGDLSPYRLWLGYRVRDNSLTGRMPYSYTANYLK